MNVIRSHTLGISTGNQSLSLALMPSLNQINSAAFATIDYSIYKAKLTGIRFIVPLTDNWNYFHGGYHDFANWFGYQCNPKPARVPKPGDPCFSFWNDTRVISTFKGYLKLLLTHVNPLTGVALKDEPTILAWETGEHRANVATGPYSCRQRTPRIR